MLVLCYKKEVTISAPDNALVDAKFTHDWPKINNFSTETKREMSRVDDSL